MKDSPRNWVLFLRDRLSKLGFTHVGYGIYLAKHALCVTYIDDIFVWSSSPLATLNELGKQVELDEPSEFKEGSEARYVGIIIRWLPSGIQFSIADYCKSLESTCRESPLVPSRQRIEALEKPSGDPNKVFLKDVGKLGWISAHHHSTQFPYSFFSR